MRCYKNCGPARIGVAFTAILDGFADRGSWSEIPAAKKASWHIASQQEARSDWHTCGNIPVSQTPKDRWGFTAQSLAPALQISCPVLHRVKCAGRHLFRCQAAKLGENSRACA